MKPLKFNKKLRLNKRTVVDLNNHEMKNAYGGATGPGCETLLCEKSITTYTCVTCQSVDTTMVPELCCICADPGI